MLEAAQSVSDSVASCGRHSRCWCIRQDTSCVLKSSCHNLQVLVEGFSKKSDAQLSGRTDTMKRVVFDDVAVPATLMGASQSASTQDLVRLKPGDYVAVEVHACSTGTLFATPLSKTTLQAFAKAHDYAGNDGTQAVPHFQAPQQQVAMSV